MAAKKKTEENAAADVVTCPGCGVSVDRSKAPTYDSRNGSGCWCPVCRGPLTVESVSNMQVGLGKGDNTAVKNGLVESLEGAGL